MEKNISVKKRESHRLSHFADVISRSSRYIRSHRKEYVPADEAQDLHEAALQLRTVPFRRLFEFANACDYLIIAIGIIFILLSGLFLPWIVYGVGLFLRLVAEILNDCRREHVCGKPFGCYVVLYYAGCSIGYAFCFILVSKRQRHRFRIEYFKGILSSDYAFLDNYVDRDLPYRMMSDVMELQHGTGINLATVLYGAEASLLMLGVSMYLNWEIALMPFLGIPFLCLLTVLKSRVDYNLNREEQTSYDHADAVARQILPNIYIIKIFEGQELELARYKAALISPFRLWKNILMSSALTATLWTLPIGLWLLVIFLSVLAGLPGIEEVPAPAKNVTCVEHGQWELPSSPLFVKIFVILVNSMCICRCVVSIIGSIIRTRKTMKKAAEIFFYVDREPRIDNLSAKGEIPRKGGIGKIELRNAYMAYPKKHASEFVLHDVSMLVHPGQMVTIFGPPGSGKSSILKVLLRLYDLTEGSAKFDGIDVQELNVGWLRQQCGYVPVDPVLFNMTIAENLSLLHRKVSQNRLEEACEKTGILNALRELPNGLDTLVGSKSNIKLPVGLIRKICLTRLLLQKPKVMLLDEILADVEEDPESDIIQLFEELRDNTTIIFTTSKMHYLVKNSDVVYAIKDGRIVEVGHHGSMVERKGAYYTMLQETLEERSTFKPFFTSQLRNYKFASTIQRQHLARDMEADFSLNDSIQKKNLRDSVLCRHLVGNHHRIIPLRKMGGIHNWFNIEAGDPIYSSGRNFRSQMICERDLRAKIAPAESVMRVTSRTSQSVIFSKRRSSSINGPGKGRRSNEIPQTTIGSETRVSRQKKTVASAYPKANPTAVRPELVQGSLVSKETSGLPYSPSIASRGDLPPGNVENISVLSSTSITTTRPTRTRFGESVTIPLESTAGSDLMLAAESDETNLTIDPGSVQVINDKLKHYIGWTVNSTQDSESISSRDSASFWDNYSRSTQLALNERSRKTPLLRLIQLARFSWLYLLFTAVSSLAVGAFLAFYAHSNFFLTIDLLDIDHHTSLARSAVRSILHSMAALAAISFFQDVVLGFGIIHANNKIRITLFRAFLACDISWYDNTENDIGFLCECLRTDPPSLNAVFISWCSHWTLIVAWSTYIIVYLVLASGLFPEAAFVIVMIPVVIAVKFSQNNWEHFVTSILGYHRGSAPGDIVFDSITNLRHAIAYGVCDLLVSRFVDAMERSKSARLLVSTTVGAVVHGLSSSLGLLTFEIFAVLCFEKLIRSDHDNPFLLRQFLFVCILLVFGLYPMSEALSNQESLADASVATWVFHDALVLQKKKKDDRRKTKPGPLPPSLSLHDVWFAFPASPSNQVLKGITMDIPTGSYIALVANINAGKSAIMGLLLNLYQPTDGTVMLNDRNYQDVDEEYLRSIIGFVEQDPTFLNYLTIAENIAYGDNTRNIGKQEIIEAAKLVRITSFIDRLPQKYRTRLEDLPENPDTFVFRQRLGIARAFIRPTKVMLVDDCTISVDDATTSTLLEALMNLRKGRTFVVASHRIEAIRDADLIYVIEDGAVVEKGTDEQLLAARGPYYERYMSQLLYEKNDMSEKPKASNASRPS